MTVLRTQHQRKGINCFIIKICYGSKNFILKEVKEMVIPSFTPQKFYYMPGSRLGAGQTKTNKRKFIAERI